MAYTPPKNAAATLRLRFPVQAYGDTVEELALRRPTGKDLRSCGNLEGSDQTLKLIELCGAVPASTVDAMDFTDILEAERILQGFSGPSSSGSASSPTPPEARPTA